MEAKAWTRLLKPKVGSEGGRRGRPQRTPSHRPLAKVQVEREEAFTAHSPESWERSVVAVFLQGYGRTGREEAALRGGLLGGASGVNLEIRSTGASRDIRRGLGLTGMTLWHLWANGGCHHSPKL